MTEMPRFELDLQAWIALLEPHLPNMTAAAASSLVDGDVPFGNDDGCIYVLRGSRGAGGRTPTPRARSSSAVDAAVAAALATLTPEQRAGMGHPPVPSLPARAPATTRAPVPAPTPPTPTPKAAGSAILNAAFSAARAAADSDDYHPPHVPERVRSAPKPTPTSEKSAILDAAFHAYDREMGRGA